MADKLKQGEGLPGNKTIPGPKPKKLKPVEPTAKPKFPAKTVTSRRGKDSPGAV